MEYYEMSEKDRIMEELKKAQEASKKSAAKASQSAESGAMDIVEQMKQAQADASKSAKEAKASTEAASEDVIDELKKAEPKASKQAPAAKQHTVVAGESLGQIALNYYGSASTESWMRIYEANKDTIGDNPSAIQVGMVLNIPE
jgi:nucleoid-associated protein YgaU